MIKYIKMILLTIIFGFICFFSYNYLSISKINDKYTVFYLKDYDNVIGLSTDIKNIMKIYDSIGIGNYKVIKMEYDDFIYYDELLQYDELLYDSNNTKDILNINLANVASYYLSDLDEN